MTFELVQARMRMIGSGVIDVNGAKVCFGLERDRLVFDMEGDPDEATANEALSSVLMKVVQIAVLTGPCDAPTEAPTPPPKKIEAQVSVDVVTVSDAVEVAKVPASEPVQKPAEIVEASPPEAEATAAEPVEEKKRGRGRGRPRGSKNKAKPSESASEEAPPAAPSAAAPPKQMDIPAPPVVRPVPNPPPPPMAPKGNDFLPPPPNAVAIPTGPGAVPLPPQPTTATGSVSPVHEVPPELDGPSLLAPQEVVTPEDVEDLTFDMSKVLAARTSMKILEYLYECGFTTKDTLMGVVDKLRSQVPLLTNAQSLDTRVAGFIPYYTQAKAQAVREQA